MTANDVLDKIQHLPKDVQERLYLYLDFLHNTYYEQGEASQHFFQAHKLSPSDKAFLEQRIAEANALPDKQLNWREARQTIFEKHKLPQ
ncbi:MAG: hypothetical protein IPN76_10450 [Saprospiraceae bacterium]|nr:hypothetical protein [Saprospiraceae bacterium]